MIGEVNSIGQFVSTSLAYITAIAGTLSVFLLIKGGYLFISSQGAPETLENAKKTIRNALIGLVIVIAASTITSLFNNSLTAPEKIITPAQFEIQTITNTQESGDLSDLIRKAIEGIIANIVSTIAEPIIKTIGQFFTTPTLSNNSIVFNYWVGMVMIANGLFALLVALLGLQFMSADTFGFEEIELRKIFPKLGLAFLLTNISLFLVDWAISLVNTLVGTVLSTGGVEKILQILITTITMLPATFLLGGIFALFFIILATVLVISYITRLIIVVIGAVLAPFVFLLWALPKYSQIAENMILSYLTTLFSIFIHVVILTLAGSFLFDQSNVNDLTKGIMGIGLILALLNIQKGMAAAVFASAQGKAIQKIGGKTLNILDSTNRALTTKIEKFSQPNSKNSRLFKVF